MGAGNSSAAARLGLGLDEYEARLAVGQKWCSTCKAWHLRSAFHRDKSRSDGLMTRCRGSRSAAGVDAPPVPQIKHAVVDVAYLAGMVDADGYISASVSITNRYVGARIGVTGSSREPHDLAAQMFGGNVTTHRPSGNRAHHKMQFHWARVGDAAVPVITALLPYVRVKRAQALLALDLQEHVAEWRDQRQSDDPYPWFAANYDPFAALVWRAREIQDLNGRNQWRRKDAA